MARGWSAWVGRIAFVLAALLAGAPLATASAEIRIGLALPLTGRQAAIGLAMQRALEGAIATVNARGGLLGDTLALRVEDDGCAQASAEGAARVLAALKPAVVIGHPCSGAAMAAAPVYSAANLLFIAVGPRHAGLTSGKLPAPLLRLAGRDDRQGEAAARWLIAFAPERRMAIVHDRTAYARAIADGAAAALAAAGILRVPVLPITAGKPDYGEIADTLATLRSEAVLFAGYPEEAAIGLAAVRKKGLAIPFLGSDALATADFAGIAKRDSAPVRVLLPTEPGGDGARALGALEAWIATAQRLGTTDGAVLNAALRGKAIQTPSLGEIRFDQNGDLVTEAFVAASARDGRWVREK